LKKRVLIKIREGNNKTTDIQDKDEYEEIRYGLDTYQSVKKAGKKGDIKKPSNPEVSIILPMSDDIEAFNRSLKSVLDQEFINFEVIISGTKNSSTLASEFEIAKDSRFRFVSSEKDGVLAELRNNGMKEVKGDFVAFLDPGDEWHPVKLARQAEYLKKSPDDVGLVYTGSVFVDEQSEKTEFLPVANGDVYRKLLHQNIIHCSSSVIIRRTVIPSIGFFDPHLPGFENHDYWLRISRFFKFEFLEDALVKCDIRNDKGSSKSSDSENKSWQRFLDKYHREIKQTNNDKYQN